jgi:lysine 2,3-aminomutase
MTSTCKQCGLCNKYKKSEAEYRGIEKIFQDERVTLIPRSNVRIRRRKEFNGDS